MVGRLIRAAAALAIIFLSVSCSGKGNSVLLIGAASSMSGVMDALIEEYLKNHDAPIETTYAASGIIYAQIMKGAPVNIYVSADMKYLGMLKDAGKVASDMILCRNSLVFAVGDSVPESASEGLGPESGYIKKIGIGNPSYSPAGRYAVSLLKEEGIYSEVQSKLVPGNNVRQVLSWLENGDVDGGFLYKTDVLSSEGVRIEGEWKRISGRTIDYPAVRIVSEDRNETSVSFMRFLRSSRAKSILRKFGFGE